MGLINWNNYPDFSENEFTCNCGCGASNIDHRLIEKLQKARNYSREITRDEFGYDSGVSFKIARGCSCKKHNISIGGSETSSHISDETTICKAADLKVDSSKTRYIIIKSLIKAGFNRIGLYNKHNGIHCDVDESKSQGVIWKL